MYFIFKKFNKIFDNSCFYKYQYSSVFFPNKNVNYLKTDCVRQFEIFLNFQICNTYLLRYFCVLKKSTNTYKVIGANLKNNKLLLVKFSDNLFIDSLNYFTIFDVVYKGSNSQFLSITLIH